MGARLSIEDMHVLARQYKGEFLSESYSGTMGKYKWVCQNGHIFEKSHNSIKYGGWCPACSGMKKKTTEDMHALAKKMGGKFLSEVYSGTNTKHAFSCDAGHEFMVKPAMILYENSWCPECCGTKKKDIYFLENLAKQNGGFLLSDEYNGAKSVYKWKCHKGHVFEKQYGSILSGFWCADCSRGGSSLGERTSRELLESMLGFSLIKARPTFLDGLELDGYNAEHKVAFEYHGEQHYNPIDYFGGVEAFNKQKERDKKKEIICRKKGIKLIIIPQFKNVYDLSGCIDQVDYCLMFAGLRRKSGWRRPKKLKFNENSLNKIFGDSYIEELKNIVSEKGGKLLSSSASSSNERLEFECSCGHVWQALARDVRSGHWCLPCSGNAIKTVAYGQELAKKINAEFISKEFFGVNKKHEWRCNCGNEWIATPGDVRKGSKCPKCFGNNVVTLDQLKEFAKTKGGDCLSEKYIDSKTPLLWICSKGHEWMAAPNNVKNKNATWCLRCQKERVTYTIDNAIKLAESKNGKFLSDFFITTKEVYWWQCECSFQWKTTYAAIRGGTWCPSCANKRKGKKNKQDHGLFCDAV